jgi:hypothetical protein
VRACVRAFDQASWVWTVNNSGCIGLWLWAVNDFGGECICGSVKFTPRLLAPLRVALLCWANHFDCDCVPVLLYADRAGLQGPL